MGSCLAIGCSEATEEGRFSNDEKRAELRHLLGEAEIIEERTPVIAEATTWEPEAPAAVSDADDLLARFDSALAADDEEEIMEYFLDLEDRGGAVAVKGMGLAIDHALDEDIKLDALGSLAMMQDEDVSAPLLRALNDRSEEVRISALEIIADFEMVQLISVLRLRKERENNEDVLESLEETIEELQYIQELERDLR